LPLAVAQRKNFKKLEFVSETDPISLLADASIVIVNDTTMVFDGLLLDKPAISIGFKDLEKVRGYAGSKAIKTVYNQQQLEEAIRKCQNQTPEDNLEREEYLEEEISELKGKSSQRIATILMELIKNKKITS